MFKTNNGNRNPCMYRQIKLRNKLEQYQLLGYVDPTIKIMPSRIFLTIGKIKIFDLT